MISNICSILKYGSVFYAFNDETCAEYTLSGSVTFDQIEEKDYNLDYNTYSSYLISLSTNSDLSSNYDIGFINAYRIDDDNTNNAYAYA